MKQRPAQIEPFEDLWIGDQPVDSGATWVLIESTEPIKSIRKSAYPYPYPNPEDESRAAATGELLPDAPDLQAMGEWNRRTR